LFVSLRPSIDKRTQKFREIDQSLGLDFVRINKMDHPITGNIRVIEDARVKMEVDDARVKMEVDDLSFHLGGVALQPPQPQNIEHDMTIAASGPKRKQKTHETSEEAFQNIYSIIAHIKPLLKKQQYQGKDVCKSLDRSVLVIQKNSAKQSKEKIKHAPNRQTGFTKPIQLLPPVAAFFSCVKGGNEEIVEQKMSRSRVTHLVNSYIETNKLQKGDRPQSFVLDENLATYFCGEVGETDTYSGFTKRIQFAFPIVPAIAQGVNCRVPKARFVESREQARAADADAVVVLSYNPHFLTKPSAGELFPYQIAMNRVLAQFTRAARELTIQERVLFFVIKEAVEVPSVFVETRTTPLVEISLSAFSFDWVRKQLGEYIATAN